MLQQRLEQFEEMVLRLGGKVSVNASGDEITLQELVMRKLYDLALAKEKPDFRAIALLTEVNANVSAAADKLRSEAAAAAFKHKFDKSEQMRELDAKRIPYIPPVPHPDDIHILTDRTVKVLGPQTEAEQAVMLVNLRKRDSYGNLLILMGTETDEELKRKNVAHYTRQWKKYDKTLPPRLRKFWPLEPVGSEPQAAEADEAAS